MKDAINTVLAMKEFELTDIEPIYIRVGHHNNNIYVDLCNSNREVIEITNNGWKIIKENVPIKFYRPSSLKPLPNPRQGKNTELFNELFSVKNDDMILFISFLMKCFIPFGAEPLLVLQGGQGTGKTTLSTMIKKTVDPSFEDIRSLPKNEVDLYISAQNSRLLCFDNLSGISDEMADCLCKVATGGAITKRKLFTDDEESVLSAKRPQILNGIDYIPKRADLQDRSIILHLPRIPDDKRGDEKAIWNKFYELQPYILGVLFDLVSNALSHYDSIKLSKTPRMADFAKWGATLDISIGLDRGTFLTAYTKNRQQAINEATEQDVLAYTLLNCLHVEKQLKGNSTFIISKLMRFVPDYIKDGNKPLVTPNKFKDEVQRIMPLLEANGVAYDFKRSGHERTHFFALKS